jgi:hypothetical protein
MPADRITRYSPWHLVLVRRNAVGPAGSAPLQGAPNPYMGDLRSRAGCGRGRFACQEAGAPGAHSNRLMLLTRLTVTYLV